jgi:hypothetical protein
MLLKKSNSGENAPEEYIARLENFQGSESNLEILLLK